MKEYLPLKILLVLSVVISWAFLLDNQVFAVKLQGKGVRQAYKHINFHIDDSYTQSYGAGLTVTAKSLFIGQESAYGFNANKLGGNLYYYKSGMEGIPIILCTKGVVLELENTGDEPLAIKWADSAIRLGGYNGVPFFPGMKYKDAGNPSLLPSTLIPPHSVVEVSLLLGNPRLTDYDGWRDGYAPVLVDESLRATVTMKVESNSGTKYYSFVTPRIIFPKEVARKFITQN